MGVDTSRHYLSAPARVAFAMVPQLCGAAAFVGGVLYFAPVVIDQVGLAWFGALVTVSSTCFATAIALAYGRISLRSTLKRDRKNWADAADELRQSKGRFDRALLGSSSGLWEWMISDDVVWMAPRFRELLGYHDESEFPSSIASWDSAIHPDDKDRVLAAVRDHLQRDESFDIEFRMRTKSGDYRWFNARGLAIRQDDGHPYLMSGSIQDIHDRKLAECTIRQMEAYTHQKHKMESLGELAGSITHEFNNILQAIGGQIQFAESALPPHSPVKEELDTASTLVDRASHLSKELLAFSYEGISQSQLVSPNDVVKQLGTILRPIIGRTVALSIRPGRNLGRIRADLASLQQALLNLCINARDAMPEGGALTLSADLAVVTAETASLRQGIQPGQFVCFSVCDTGCGIPADIVAKLFEPFFTTKGRGKGTGLGLSIAYNIARQHGGFIDVDSQAGTGSTFRMWIPSAQDATESHAPRQTPSTRPDHAGRMRILYAEDHIHVRRNTCRSLRRFGYQVIAAEDGTAALHEFEKHARSIDLLLLDVSLPQLDGIELFRRIRQSHPQIPVIFCTAYAKRIESTDILEHRDTYIISKPCSMSDLQRVVDEAIRRADQCA